MSSILDLRRLRYFRMIATRGSLSAAARALHVSQPALTHHMHELEVALGTSVFERSARGVALTDAGRLLLRHAVAILDEVANAESELLDFVRGKSARQTIKIAMTHSLGSTLAPYLLAEVSERLPTLSLRIANEPDSNCHDLVDRSECDFAIMFARPDRPRAVPLTWQSLFFVVAARLAAGKAGEPITLSAMAREPLILPSHGSELRQVIENAAVPAGLNLNIVAEIHGVVPRKQAVMAGLGGTVLPWEIVASECKAELLVARPIVDPKLERLIVQESRLGIDPEIAAIIGDIAKRAVMHALED